MPSYSKSIVFAIMASAPTLACGDSTGERLDVADEVGDSESADSTGSADEAASQSGGESASSGAQEGSSGDLDGGSEGASTTEGTSAGSSSTGDGDGESSTSNADTTTSDADTTNGDTATGDGDSTTSGAETATNGDEEGFELDPQCSAPYQVLDLADRNVQFNDGDGNVEWCDRLNGGNHDPQWAGWKWYRFMDGAGTRMPVNPPTLQSCGAEAPGWMLGAHPAVLDGVVSRTACFSWSNDTCQWSTDIEVVDCGDFYLYHLANTTTCALRYCGTD